MARRAQRIAAHLSNSPPAHGASASSTTLPALPTYPLGATETFRMPVIVDQAGERHSVPVSSETGVPCLAPMLWAVSCVRPRSASFRTVEQSLRGALRIHQFSAEHGIDLLERVRCGTFFATREVDRFVAWLRSCGGGKANAERSASTRACRIRAAMQYVSWLASVVGGGSDSSDLIAARRAGRDDFLERLGGHVPRCRSEPQRTSTTREQQIALIAAINAPLEDSPWCELVAARNWLLVLTGVLTGLRLGEVLSIRVGDVDLTSKRISVVRRPDDPEDSRVRQPAVKGLGRLLEMPAALEARLAGFIDEVRPRFVGAVATPMLFLAEGGRPLSANQAGKVYRDIRRHYPAVGPLSAHVLRHNFAEAFSRAVDAAGLSPAAEKRARCHQAGYRDPRSAEPYLRRHVADAAARLTELVQAEFEGLMGEAE